MLAAASAIGTTLLQVDLTSVFCSGDIVDASLSVRLEEDFAVRFFAVLPALIAPVLLASILEALIPARHSRPRITLQIWNLYSLKKLSTPLFLALRCSA